MLIKNMILSALLLLGCGFIELHGQESIPVSGGEATGTGGSISYSVGQLVYTTNTGTTGSVAQGVLQPFEISVVSGIKETLEISLILNVYPNPTIDYLMLRVENFKRENLTYKLLDVNGKLLVNKNIVSNETRIDMRLLIPATYFLNVNQDNKKVKTFKIIKN